MLHRPNREFVCEECKVNKATFHSVKIINGMRAEKHLCTSCQSGAAVLEPTSQSAFADFFSNFSSLVKNVEHPLKRGSKTCGNCGITMNEVLNSGLLGCSVCYDTFIEVLMPMIQKVQAGNSHKGKNPEGKKSLGYKELEFVRLKKELGLALEVENYEEAAKIHAALKALEGGKKS